MSLDPFSPESAGLVGDKATLVNDADLEAATAAWVPAIRALRAIGLTRRARRVEKRVSPRGRCVELIFGDLSVW